MKQPIFLRVIFKGNLVEVKQFTGSQIVIGKGDGQIDLAVDDPEVSPIHVMIEEREPGKYYLCDLGAPAGTFYKGEKIVDLALESGCEFNIGQHTIEFHIGIPRPKAAGSATAAKPAPVVTAPKQEVKKAPAKPPPSTQSVSTIPERPSSRPPLGPPGGVKPLSDVKSKKGTFSPGSQSHFHTDLKPTKGTVVEIALCWKDRVLDTFHYAQRQVIHVGSHPGSNEIVLPMFGSVKVSHPLVSIDGLAHIMLTPDMTGEVVRERGRNSFDELKRQGSLQPQGGGFVYSLQQGEVAKVEVGDGVHFIIRYVAPPPPAVMAPLFDLTAGQIPYVVLGLLGMGLFLLWVFLYYTPQIPEINLDDKETQRKVIFKYNVPKKVVDVSEEPTAKRESIKTPKPPAPDNRDEGAAAEAKPNSSKNKQKVLTADKNKNTDSKVVNQVTGGKAEAPQPPKPKDVSRLGLLNVFGTKGVQDSLKQAKKTSGDVQGLSQSAKGEGSDTGAGNSKTGLRETGLGGKGTATVGIADVGTKGKGGGLTGYGTGNIGGKKNASIVAGDSDATFSGTIDKEAIRRVVQQNIKQIKACYEKGLNKDPGLYGKLVIQWTIAAGGRVLEAHTKTTTLNSPEVENCAVARLKNWKFPEPPANEQAVVSYPFVFQAQE